MDTWLWAARFVKTRALAQEAINGGKVDLNGRPAKPGKDVKPGDRVEMTLGQTRLTVDVVGTATRRGPAKEASLLYEETPESRARREKQAEMRRLAPPPVAPGGARPTKRDRRRLALDPNARRGRR